MSSSSSFSIHISLQLSPLGPFFSLCPLKRVLIFPHPDPGSFTFSLPFFLPGTSVSQLPHSQPHPSPSLFPSLFPFYPMPGHTAPTDSVSDSISSSLSPTPLRSPYSSGVPSILHLCPISLVLDLPLILVSNTPFLVPSSSSLLPVFLGPHLPQFLSPSPLVLISISPTLGPHFSQRPQSSHFCSYLSTPVLLSPSQNSISVGPITPFPDPIPPIPILIWPRVPISPSLFQFLDPSCWFSFLQIRIPI